MSDHPLRGHSAECATKLSESPALADTVHDIVPMMSTLVDAADQYFLPEHYRSDPDQSADRHDSTKLERGSLVLSPPGRSRPVYQTRTISTKPAVPRIGRDV